MDRLKTDPVFLAVVDDEEDLARLFRDALDQIPNAEVFAFSDPVMALEHFRVNSDKYGCIISDLRMPNLSGIQLLNEVKKIKPTIKCVLITAFETGNGFLDEHQFVDTFLQKPVPIRRLVQVVQESLSLVTIEEVAKPAVRA